MTRDILQGKASQGKFFYVFSFSFHNYKSFLKSESLIIQLNKLMVKLERNPPPATRNPFVKFNWQDVPVPTVGLHKS